MTVNREDVKISALYRDPSRSLAFPWLAQFEFPWEALDGLTAFVRCLGEQLPDTEYEQKEKEIWVARSAKIAPTANLFAPCIVGKDAEIRPGAFIRGGVLIGESAVVGNSTELKNCILFDGVQVPHYNYVGDSILGYKSHLGAGAVTSNVKSDKTPVTILFDDERIETGRKKLGAMIGDRVEVGCNSVLNPGTVIGCDSNVYPRSSVRGYVAPNSIFKDADNVVTKH